MSSVVRSKYSLGVRDLMHRPGEMREVSLNFNVPERLGEGLVSVPQGGPLELDVRLESVHEGILVSGELSAAAEGVCGRCLVDIIVPVQVDFQELFAYPSGEAFDFEVHDDHVDLEPLVRDTVVLSLPFQPVCRPDCPGLDPETGERLDGPAGREPGTAIDPRWAALADFPASDDAAGRSGSPDSTGSRDREE